MSTKKSADLVLEGGGVKGLGLVGAISALEEHKFTFHRIAGTSAGAIVGSLTAAGLGSTAMKRMMQQIDYTKFRDKNLLDQVGPPGELVSLLVKKGVYEGNYLHTWLRGQLDKLGVRTFGDLRITDDWAQDLPPEQRYKLVVIASDVTRGELVRLPWDYRRYGLDPDRQLVADAVRASMSIPFFYKPAKLRRSWLLDGSYLSNFPTVSLTVPTSGMHAGQHLGSSYRLSPRSIRLLTQCTPLLAWGEHCLQLCKRPMTGCTLRTLVWCDARYL